MATDELKPFDFPAHGAIDGYGRKVLWLNVVRSNNCHHAIAHIFLKLRERIRWLSCKTCNRFRDRKRSSYFHTYFWEDIDAHIIYLSQNKRIECWWSFYLRTRGSWWQNLFRQLEANGTLDTSSEIDIECLWYCFSKILQQDLNTAKNLWTSHRIRKSWFKTTAARPDALFFFTISKWRWRKSQVTISQHELEEVAEYVSITGEENDYQDYFEYVQAWSRKLSWILAAVQSIRKLLPIIFCTKIKTLAFFFQYFMKINIYIFFLR